MFDQIFLSVFAHQTTVTKTEYVTTYPEIRETNKLYKRFASITSWENLRIVYRYFGDESDKAIELINRESGFNSYAKNPTSGACGLVQALPCSKLPCEMEEVTCQIKWGKEYISQRYGTASQALAFHDRNGYY